jgi:hypothetical protein
MCAAGAGWWWLHPTIRLDTEALQTADRAGDAQAYATLRNRVASTPATEVANDSRSDVALLLDHHMAAVIDDASDPQFAARWKLNLFEIAELNQDETVNAARSGVTRKAVQDWALKTIDRPEGYYKDEKASTALLSPTVLHRIGNAWALATEPEVWSHERADSHNGAIEAKLLREEDVERLVLAGEIAHDPGLVNRMAVEDRSPEGAAAQARIEEVGFRRALDEALVEPDPDQATTRLGKYLRRVIDDPGLSTLEGEVGGDAKAAADAFSIHVDRSKVI